MTSSTNRMNRLDWKSLEGSVAEVLKPAIRDSQYGQNLPVNSVAESPYTLMPVQVKSVLKKTGSTDEFEFFEELSNDTWMTIHAAYDRRLNRDVMIRQLKPIALQDAEITQQFWEKATRLASIEHHHVARVHAVDPQRGWIILERLTNSVATRLERGQRYTSDEAFVLFKQALEGLSAFHERGQSHGAICTETLALTQRGWLKLTDPQGFSLDDELPLPDATRRHLAPEMLSPDEFGTVGPATDLYCLGFAILDAMAGEKLDRHIGLTKTTGADAAQAWTYWHTSPRQQLPDLATLVPGISEQFQQALRNITHKKISLRPQTAAVVLKQLNQQAAVSPSCDLNVNATHPVDQVADLQQFQLKANTTPGAVLLGQNASVYSIPDEIINEPDLLDKLSDIQWWNEQAKRPVVYGCAFTVFVLVSFVLMQSPVKPEAPKPVELKKSSNLLSEEMNSLPDGLADPSPESKENGNIAAVEQVAEIPDPEEVLEAELEMPREVIAAEEQVRVPVQITHPRMSWPLECRDGQHERVQAAVEYFLNDAWSQIMLSTATQQTYEQAQRAAPLEPRVAYAYGLLLVKLNQYDNARAAFETAMELQDQLFQKKTELARVYEGGPVPVELQPVPDMRPRQMLIWTTLMECSISQELVAECALQIQNMLQVMNEELPPRQPSAVSQELRNESIQFAGRSAGLLKAHFADRLRREAYVTDWEQRCESSLVSLNHPASEEELELFRTSMAEIVVMHRYEMEALIYEHETIVAQQAKDPAGPVITKEQTIEVEILTKREQEFTWGDKTSERTFTSKLKIVSNPVRTYPRRKPQLSDVSLRAVLPPDLSNRRDLLKQSIPQPESEVELVAR